LVNAQDNRNPQPVININDTLLVKSTDKFIKAWNWNALDRKVDSAMLMIFYHCNFDWNSWNMHVNLPYQFPNGQWTLQAFAPTSPNRTVLVIMTDHSQCSRRLLLNKALQLNFILIPTSTPKTLSLWVVMLTDMSLPSEFNIPNWHINS
jgi:hypothetical protein